jgi:hypothetical protein
MSLFGNLIGYQIAWFIGVIGAARDLAWPGLCAAVAFVVWQLLILPQRALQVRLLLAGLVCGMGLDGGLAASGLLHYAAAHPALPPAGAPLWILALWACFSLTLTRSLGWLRGRPLAAVLLGAIGAPLAYLAAARGFHAVRFPQPAWPAVMVLAAGWAAAMLVWSLLIGRAAAPPPSAA